MSRLPTLREFVTTPGYRVLAEGGWYDDDRRAMEESGQQDPNVPAPFYITRAANNITNELVKSYGFAYTDEGWDWSFDRIQQSFKDEPFWTTLDYLTLAVPVLSWGKALRTVEHGASAIGRAYAAGEFVGRAPTTAAGKIVGQFKGMELAAAAEKQRWAPSRLGSMIGNPITLNIDDEYMRFVDKYGGKPWERRGIAQMHARELALEKSVYEKETQQIIGQLGRSKLDQTQQRAAYDFLENAVQPNDPLVRQTLGDSGAAAYERTFAFRNRIHNEAFRLGMISAKTHSDHLEKYAPRLYAEWETLKAQGWKADDALRRVSGSGADHFKARLDPNPDPALTELLNPQAGVAALGRAAFMVANQNYAQKLAKSVIAKDSNQLGLMVQRVVSTGDVAQAKLLGIVPGGLKVGDDAVRAHLANLKQKFDKAAATSAWSPEIMLRNAGWQPVDDLFRGLGEKYIDNLPVDLLDKWIDPAAAKDVVGLVKWGTDNPNILSKLYNTMLGTFKATKTAYNPATFMRNNIGNVVTHHFVTGGTPTLFPKRGWRAFMDDTADYREFIETGHASASSLSEIRDDLRAAGVWKEGREATALDWMGDTPFARWMQKGAGYLERAYGAIDEIWKLDAYLVRRDELVKGGMAKPDAAAEAVSDITKYMQTFATHSAIGDKVRQVVPFATFTTEALRIWKNALAEKPHLAFFWNHFAETASTTFAAMAGFSQEDLENAKDGLPAYMNNKKLLALPFKVDGRPMFVDLSYVIPLANLVEAERGERLFFNELYDPTSNPLVGLAAAAAANYNVFTKRELEPRFTERQLGIPVENPTARRAVGLAEYTLQMFTPPLAPWGFAGVNLLEAARGQRSPATGSELEQNILQTVLANVGGMRTYKADVSSQVQNVLSEQAKRNELIGQEWKRYEWAHANGDASQMERSRKRLVAMKLEEGTGPADAESWFTKSAERRQPGSFSNLSTKQIEETLARTERIGPLSDDEKRLQTELLLRYHSRTARAKRKGTESE